MSGGLYVGMSGFFFGDVWGVYLGMCRGCLVGICGCLGVVCMVSGGASWGIPGKYLRDVKGMSEWCPGMCWGMSGGERKT